MFFLLFVYFQEPIFIKGSSTLYPVISAIAMQYTKATGREIQVSRWGSDFGVQFALAGQGIGMTSRPLTEKEKRKGAKSWPVGKGRIVILVNPQNPVDVVSQDQIKAIFSGEITDWSEISTEGKGPIEILGLSKRHGTTDFWDTLPGLPEIIPVETYLSHDSLRMAISKNPNAIGWSSLNLSQNQNLAKILLVDGQNPVDSQNYPYERGLFLVTRMNPAQSWLDFIDFVQEPNQRKFFERNGLFFTEL